MPPGTYYCNYIESPVHSGRFLGIALKIITVLNKCDWGVCIMWLQCMFPVN